MSASKTSLFDDLRARKAKEAESKVDWPARKREWLEDLRALVANVRVWLKPGVEEGLVEIVEAPVHLSEDFLGPYIAPSLRIEMVGKVVQLEPVGTLIIGAFGRVDMSCGPAQAKLLRSQSREWKFRVGHAGTPADFLDVTEATFTEALRELIQ